MLTAPEIIALLENRIEELKKELSKIKINLHNWRFEHTDEQLHTRRRLREIKCTKTLITELEQLLKKAKGI